MDCLLRSGTLARSLYQCRGPFCPLSASITLSSPVEILSGLHQTSQSFPSRGWRRSGEEESGEGGDWSKFRVCSESCRRGSTSWESVGRVDRVPEARWGRRGMCCPIWFCPRQERERSGRLTGCCDDRLGAPGKINSAWTRCARRISAQSASH